MEHDSSSRSGYHEPEPGDAGLLGDDDWREGNPEVEVPASVNLIWAQATAMDGRRGAMGQGGAMPWHLTEDMRHFKELTISHPVIMGRKTWQSLGGRPLPNRDNIVVSSDVHFKAPRGTVVSDPAAALELARQEAIPDDGIDRHEIWVIGGAELFRSILPAASRAFVTDLDVQVPADTFAPDIEELVHDHLWRLTERGGWKRPARTDQARLVPRFRYSTYEKVR